MAPVRTPCADRAGYSRWTLELPSVSSGLSTFHFDVPDAYALLRVLGTGASGVVAEAEVVATGERVAIKRVVGAFSTATAALNCLREVTLMRAFDHANVVGLLDAFAPPARAPDDAYLVEPLMESDLHRVIYSGQALSDDHVRVILVQIYRALRELHAARVLHRDVKPANILIN